MYGKELKTCIEKIPFVGENFDGIYNLQDFPMKIKERHFVILNKQVNNSEVGHWILLLRVDDETIEVFDSLGGTESDIQPFKNLSTKLFINGTQVQGPLSKNCGIYCLYTAFWRLTCLDQTFESVLTDIFSKNYSVNEERIEVFFKRYCQ